MSKLIGIGSTVVIVLGLLAPIAASAAVDCTANPGACSGGTIPTLLTMPWGLTGGETPTIAPGTSITDGYGHTFTCPWWFPPAGCYDITKTAYYRTTVLGIR